MSKYSRSSIRVSDPYCFLALSAINQAFRDIECYFNQNGTPQEIKEGKESIKWIVKMEGNFRSLATATDMPLDKFHQKCIHQINKLKQEAYERKLLATEAGKK